MADSTSSKRPRLEEEGSNQTSTENTSGFTLWTPTFYKCAVKISRKQHITVTQYKPGDNSEFFSITVLPVSVFDFWVQEGNGWREPFNSISKTFPYCNFISAHLRISNFIPMQRSLNTTTATDVTSFNMSPYIYISEDTDGYTKEVSHITALSQSNWQKQTLRAASSFYFLNTDDSGLLNVNNTKTLTSGETFVKNYTFEKNSRFFIKTPAYSTTQCTLMPGDYININNYIAQWKKNNSASTTNTYGLYNPQMSPIFLYLPYIEAATTSEDVVRMMGHLLLETELILELYSDRDGYNRYGGSQSPYDTVTLNNLQYGDNVFTVPFPNFRK